MNGLSLYDIAGGYRDLAYRLMDGEELTEEELACMHMEIDAMLAKKSTGIIAYDREIANYIAAAENEIKRITDIKKRAEREQERHRAYVKSAMEYGGITEVTTDIGRLKIKKNPTSISVVEELEVPDEWMNAKLEAKGCLSDITALAKFLNGSDVTYTVERSVDKKGIAAHLRESGEIVSGCVANTENTRLEIK